MSRRYYSDRVTILEYEKIIGIIIIIFKYCYFNCSKVYLIFCI